MNDRNAPERVSEALVRAFTHWKRSGASSRGHSPDDQPRAQSIAISRQTGARGNTVAREVGQQLGWLVYDHELLERIAQEMNVRVSLLESIDERRISWLEEQVEAFSHVPYVSESAYCHHLVQTVLSLGLHGECIILGRGSTFILPARTTLRVRLVAGLEDRIGVMAQEFGISSHEAARLVRETDRQRAAFIREHFHQDVADPLNYDLVLNTSRLTVPECARLIVSALRKDQRRGSAPRLVEEPVAVS